MPRKPWKIRGAGLMRDRLTEAMYDYYAFGPYFPECRQFEEETSESERTELWARHRETIMARYMDELRRQGKWYAGKRPDFFWRELADQGHERQKIGTNSYWPPWGTHGPGPAKHERVYDLIESDWQFLNRLGGLLEPWELEAGDPHGGKGKAVFE